MRNAAIDSQIRHHVFFPLRFPFFLLAAFVGVGIAIAAFEGPRSLVAAQKQESEKANESKIRFGAEFAKIAPVPVDQVALGWIGLFDGGSMYGWRYDEGAWAVEQGQLVNLNQNSMIRTASQFDNFELSIQYKCSEDCEASLFLRTSPSPSDPKRDCYQIKLASADPKQGIGSIVGRLPGNGVVAKREGWTQMRVTLTGGSVSVYLDGERVSYYQDMKPLGRGYIGLRSDAGEIQFRQVWLRPSCKIPIRDNPLDFDVWKSSQGNDFLAVNEGSNQSDTFKLTGGPGYIESRDQYKDFVLQLQAKVSRGGNSGVFFRCFPGQNMNGYESQIDNTVVDGTDFKPANCGTGGVFRRKDARRVVALDGGWFAKTIVVEGPHVAVWVNGYQVTDWTDKRERDSNPRRGLRTKRGTLMLQGHDSETTAWFRGLKIQELSERNRK